LRSFLWSSIDNETSRDLDQVEYVEALPDGRIRLLVGIADVDAFVPKNSAIDAHAASETTSVYTGVTVFPMLPAELSTDATSLLDQQDRTSLIIEIQLGSTGQAIHHDFYLAQIRNHAKLAYSSVGAWLEGRGPIPDAVAAVPGMEPQLRLQQALAGKLLDIRKQHGALAFSSIEATPEVEDGIVKQLKIQPHNMAADIIESFMITANVAMATFLRERSSLSIRRVVKTPKRWDRIQALASQLGTRLPDTPDPRALSEFLNQRRAADPDHFADLSLSIVKLLGRGEYTVESPGQEHTGHFGLAENDYTHSTAPNRRFADLVTQRLLKAALSSPGSMKVSADRNSEPYSQPELSAIAAHCTEREDAANKVERLMRKVAAASLLIS
jgi:exoribonuclease-2